MLVAGSLAGLALTAWRRRARPAQGDARYSACASLAPGLVLLLHSGSTYREGWTAQKAPGSFSLCAPQPNQGVTPKAHKPQKRRVATMSPRESKFQSMMDREYWQKALSEAERELVVATTRSGLTRRPRR
jgi:hypothetical protein